MLSHISAYDWHGITASDVAHHVASALDAIDVRILRAVSDDPGRTFEPDKPRVGNLGPTKTALLRLRGPLKLPSRSDDDVRFRDGASLVDVTKAQPRGPGIYVDPLDCSYRIGEFGRMVLDAIDGNSILTRYNHPDDSHAVWRLTEGELDALRQLSHRPMAISRLVRSIGYHSWPEAAEGQQIVHSLLRTEPLGQPHERRPDGGRFVRPPLAIDVFGDVMKIGYSRLVIADAGMWLVERLWDPKVEGRRHPKVLKNWKLTRGGRANPKTWEW